MLKNLPNLVTLDTGVSKFGSPSSRTVDSISISNYFLIENISVICEYNKLH
jgi:hypothetical protein